MGNAIGRGYLNPLVLGSKTALVLENNEGPNYSELNIPCTWLNVGRSFQHSVKNISYLFQSSTGIIHNQVESGNTIALDKILSGTISDGYVTSAKKSMIIFLKNVQKMPLVSFIVIHNELFIFIVSAIISSPIANDTKDSA